MKTYGPLRIMQLLFSVLLFVAFLSCNGPTEVDNEETIDIPQTEKLLLYSDVSSMPTNGGMANILVKVFSGNDTTSVVNNAQVSFSSSIGQIQIQNNQTDAKGYARAIVYAGKHTGRMAVTASTQDFSNTIFITITPGTHLISAEPEQIIADGRSESIITARAIDSMVRLSPHVAVSFSTTAGSITPQSYADDQGTATAVLRSIVSDTDITATISAQSQITKRVPDTQTSANPAKSAAVQSSLGSSVVVFRGITISIDSEKNSIYANNADSTMINISVTETTSGDPVSGTKLSVSSTNGLLRKDEVLTDNSGNASVILFGGDNTGTAVVTATIMGQLSSSTEVELSRAVSLALSAQANSLSANGRDTTEIYAVITDSFGNPVEGETVYFTTSLGSIKHSAQTDQWGQATAELLSATTSGDAIVKAVCRTVEKTVTVAISEIESNPQSILLQTNPSVVSVRGTGKNENLTLQADVKDSNDNPITDGLMVQFELIGKYDESCSITPNDGIDVYRSVPVPTVDGSAAVVFHAGTQAGTMRVRATLTDSTGAAVFQDVASETTPLQVLAGPPYFNTDDVTHPFENSHMTIAASSLNIYAGELNTEVSKSDITVMVGDIYHNPASENTAVYFTTTGGIVTSQTGFTDVDGLATVTLYNANPFPTLENSGSIDNLNSSLGGPETFDTSYDPDGDGQDNNGIGIVTAYTQGLDQEGRQALVWDYIPIIFSLDVSTFTVIPAETSIPRGSSTPIFITIHDINNNPIVGGSKLEYETPKGELSTTEFETDTPGVITYSVTLINNLGAEDSPVETTVTVKLTSANGKITVQSVPILLE